jgi:hypothetical protein
MPGVDKLDKEEICSPSPSSPHLGQLITKPMWCFPWYQWESRPRSSDQCTEPLSQPQPPAWSTASGLLALKPSQTCLGAPSALLKAFTFAPSWCLCHQSWPLNPQLGRGPPHPGGQPVANLLLCFVTARPSHRWLTTSQDNPTPPTHTKNTWCEHTFNFPQW